MPTGMHNPWDQQQGCRRCHHCSHRLPMPTAVLAYWLVVWAAMTHQAQCYDTLEPCASGPHCVILEVDGTLPGTPPLFLQAITNSSVREIVLAGNRYILRPSAWAIFSQQQPYVLRRNVTVRGRSKAWSVMDFSLIEKKILLGPGVTVTFKNLVLQNIRKLGGFGLDFFMGQSGSMVWLQDTIRVKPACQFASSVLRSAKSFQRYSPALPENNVTLVPRFCFTAALDSAQPQLNCFDDSLQFEAFSTLSGDNDPDKGVQYPGYVLYQQATTRVCQEVITQQCLEEHNGDEELCLALLVASQGLVAVDGARSTAAAGPMWTPGATAGVAIAGATLLVLLFVLVISRRKIARWIVQKRRRGKQWQDPELGSSHNDIDRAHQMATNDSLPSYTSAGNRAISQQVTLGVLLGAGSFGRVYRGRWHSSDVAIKIITVRRPDELPKVLREAEVMMQLNHPNIVRAFHASVWNPAEQLRALQGRGVRTSGSFHARPPASTELPDVLSLGMSAQQHRGPRRSSSFPNRLAAPRAAAEAAAAAVAHSAQHLTTPVIADEPGQQLHSSSTNAAPISSSASHAGKAAAAGLGMAATAAVASGREDGSTSSRAAGPSADGTGWMQLLPRVGTRQRQPQLQQQPQQQPQQSQQQLQQLVVDHGQHPSILPVASDCAASQRSDVNSTLLHGTLSGHGNAGLQGLSAGQAAAGCATAPPARQPPSPDVSKHGAPGGNDPALFQPDVQPSLQQQQPQRQKPCSPSRQQQQQSPAQQQQQQQPPQKQQQQQHDGGLRRHLLMGWRQWSRGSSGGGPNSSSSNRSHTQPQGSGDAAMHVDGSAAAAACGGAGDGAGGGPVSSNGGGAASASISATLPASGVIPVISTPATQQGSLPGGSNHSGTGPVLWADADSHRQQQEHDDDRQAEVQVWIILELCSAGTLMDAVAVRQLKSDSKFEMAKLLSRLLDAAEGMAYLHSKGVLHGDLKAGNVLLQHSIHGSYGQIAKISDFGLSAVLLNGATHRSTASLGTITHMAPELLKSGRMSPSADVYSFGILMWEVFCGKQAWQGLHYGVVVERVVVQKERPPIPDNMPDEFALLMCSCWDADPTKRPSFPQIVACLELLLDNLADNDNDPSQSTELPSQASAGVSSSSRNAAVQQWQQLAVNAPAAGAAAVSPAPAASAATAAGAAAAAPAVSSPVAVGVGSSCQVPATPLQGVSVHEGCLLVGSAASPCGSYAASHSQRSHSSRLHNSQQPAAIAAGGRQSSGLDENLYLRDL